MCWPWRRTDPPRSTRAADAARRLQAGSGSLSSEGAYDRIYRVVRRIPAGRVATYGQVAILAEIPNGARQVGYALAALKEDSAVPWHRVVNARGRISPRAEPFYERLQRSLLEMEGVEFDAAGRLALERHRWEEDDA